MLTKSKKTPLANLFLEMWATTLFWFNLLPTVYLWIIAGDLYPQDIKKIFRDAGIQVWNVEITDAIYITFAVRKSHEQRARRLLEKHHILVT